MRFILRRFGSRVVVSSEAALRQAEADEEQMAEARKEHSKALKRADAALSSYVDAAERTMENQTSRARLER